MNGPCDTKALAEAVAKLDHDTANAFLVEYALSSDVYDPGKEHDAYRYGLIRGFLVTVGLNDFESGVTDEHQDEIIAALSSHVATGVRQTLGRTV